MFRVVRSSSTFWQGVGDPQTRLISIETTAADALGENVLRGNRGDCGKGGEWELMEFQGAWRSRFKERLERISRKEAESRAQTGWMQEKGSGKVRKEEGKG